MTRHHVGTVFDPGLQPERTGLAWRRTGIALATASLIALRVLPDAGGTWWLLLPGLAGLGVAIGVLAAAERRYRRTHRQLTGHPRRLVGGGRILLATALATGLLAAAALTYVIGRS
ncbi:DUF202 domain-containing protein [Saccharomonospora sp. NPDC046836]|uniref:DUF202 domain-containing protein n=1 Tax=Saccharomonospora sp. NPDC046836 TaxID=3156921 RepID=UPI0033CEF25F